MAHPSRATRSNVTLTLSRSASAFQYWNAEALRDSVKVTFERVARLGCAMPAFGSTRRLVGQHAHALPAVRRHVLAHRLQRTGVVQRCRAIAHVRAAIDEGLEVHGFQLT